MKVRDLTVLLHRRSLENIASMSLRREGDGSPRFSLKAYGYFAPTAFEVQAIMVVITSKGAEIVRGALHMVPIDAPRGVWFHYDFMPNDVLDNRKIVFWGVNQFSNVLCVILLIGNMERKIRNPFFRLPVNAA